VSTAYRASAIYTAVQPRRQLWSLHVVYERDTYKQNSAAISGRVSLRFATRCVLQPEQRTLVNGPRITQIGVDKKWSQLHGTLCTILTRNRNQCAFSCHSWREIFYYFIIIMPFLIRRCVTSGIFTELFRMWKINLLNRATSRTRRFKLRTLKVFHLRQFQTSSIRLHSYWPILLP
jgi:hypothetical protein